MAEAQRLTATERLRALVRDRMTRECSECGHVKRISLIAAEKETGVDSTVLHRFLAGGSINSDTLDALERWTVG